MTGIWLAPLFESLDYHCELDIVILFFLPYREKTEDLRSCISSLGSPYSGWQSWDLDTDNLTPEPRLLLEVNIGDNMRFV